MDNLIRLVCDIKGAQCDSDADDQTPCGVEGPVGDLVEQFDLRITQCVRDQLTKDQEERSVIIIIDDNMYYCSMRYKYYQLARKCQYHYTNMRYKYYQLARKCQYHLGIEFYLCVFHSVMKTEGPRVNFVMSQSLFWKIIRESTVYENKKV